MSQVEVPQTQHPCVAHGHDNKVLGKVWEYVVKECKVCRRQVYYDYLSNRLMPIATLFITLSNLEEDHIPEYLEDSYKNWLKLKGKPADKPGN